MTTMIKKTIWTACAIGLIYTFGASAQILIKKSGSGKSTINLSGIKGVNSVPGATFLKTLEKDLLGSGWFKPVRKGGSEFNILGDVSTRGRSLRVECRVYGTANQRSYLSKAYTGSDSDVRALAHQVSDDIVEAITGHKGIASTRIAMCGTRTGKKELYLCDADGGGMIQLTHDKNLSISPRWTPDGKKLTYTSYLRRFPDVYMITLASGQRKAIASYPGLNTGAAVSPDGRDCALILSRDGNPELYIKNLQSGKLTRLTRTRAAVEASPSWSPDGSRIVYVSDQSGRPQLYIIARSGGRPRRLTSRGTENVAPDWGPNGLIAYSSRIGRRYQINLINPETLEITTFNTDGADYEDPSWAPDGRHLACSRSERYHSQVYLLDMLGDPPVRLHDYKGDWSSPAWSPR